MQAGPIATAAPCPCCSLPAPVSRRVELGAAGFRRSAQVRLGEHTRPSGRVCCGSGAILIYAPEVPPCSRPASS